MQWRRSCDRDGPKIVECDANLRPPCRISERVRKSLLAQPAGADDAPRRGEKGSAILAEPPDRPVREPLSRTLVRFLVRLSCGLGLGAAR